jgi:hypothetical protein
LACKQCSAVVRKLRHEHQLSVYSSDEVRQVARGLSQQEHVGVGNGVADEAREVGNVQIERIVAGDVGALGAALEWLYEGKGESSVFERNVENPATECGRGAKCEPVVRIRNAYYAGTVGGADLQRVTFGGLAGQPDGISAVNAFVAVSFELENIVDLKLDILAPNTISASATNFWWDVDLSGEMACHSSGDGSDMLHCNPANIDGTDPDYFASPENEPMASWEFGEDQIWTTDGGPYSILAR